MRQPSALQAARAPSRGAMHIHHEAGLGQLLLETLLVGPEPISHRRRRQPRALTEDEQQAIFDALHSDRFADVPPAEGWATLLDEGVYLGSILTFYRLLRQAGEVRERRAQATHRA